MAHGSALKYVGNYKQIFPGVKLGDHTPAQVEALPAEWPAENLVASGEFEWAPKDEVLKRPLRPDTKAEIKRVEKLMQEESVPPDADRDATPA